MLTPKQKEIYAFVKRFGDKGHLTAMDVGIEFGQPRKKAKKWAQAALKELVKQKLVDRNGDGYKKRNSEEDDSN